MDISTQNANNEIGLANNREFRIFISSTFRDMHDERDMLNQEIFPEIRKICWERGVNFSPIDLRWGINTEETKRGDILRICLDEVAHSKPFFIGLLGQRYGWIPDLTSSFLHNQEQNSFYSDILSESLIARRSITEIEILCGVLQAPEGSSSDAFFYFKEDNQIPEDETDDSLFKLAQLKDRIRKWADETANETRLLDGYKSLDELAQKIRGDLIEIIERRWPIDEIPNQIEQERAKHLAFSQSRLEGYIADDDALKYLNQHLHLKPKTTSLFVVTGEPGVGKSSLLAEFAHSQKQRNNDYFIFEHYIGAHGSSSGLELVHRLLNELSTFHLAKKDASVLELSSRPSAPDTLQTYLIEQLNIDKRPMLLIFDALNQLDLESQNLGWLPTELPEHVRVIVSTTSAKFSEESESNVWQALNNPKRGLGDESIMELLPLSPLKQIQIIESFSTRYRKNFDYNQLKMITSSSLVHNPLYLRSLLEELRLFGRIQSRDAEGVNNEVSEVLERYLKVDQINDFFELVLSNREEYFGAQLTKDILSLILSSKQGLSDYDLFKLLNPDETVRFPIRDILAILRSFELHISHSSVDGGLYKFFHHYIKKAVTDKYELQPFSQVKLAYHHSLAEYFDFQILTTRTAIELPWQYQQLKQWIKLQQVLTRVDYFLKSAEEELPLTTLGHWLAMPEIYRKQMTESYLQMYYDPKIIFGIPDRNSKLFLSAEHMPPHFGLGIARILRWTGCLMESRNIYEHLLFSHPELKKSTKQLNQVARTELAGVLMELGDTEATKKLLIQVIDDEAHSIGNNHQEALITKHDQAMLFAKIGDYQSALQIFYEVLDIQVSMLGSNHLDTLTTKHNLAQTLQEMGGDNLTEAMQIYQHILPIWTSKYGENHPNALTTRCNIAGIYMQMSEFRKARDLYKDILVNREELLGMDHPETLLVKRNLGYAMQHLGDHLSAIEYLLEVLAVTSEKLEADHEDNISTRINLAYSYEAVGKISEACTQFIQVLDALSVTSDNLNFILETTKKVAHTLYISKENTKAYYYYAKLFELQRQNLGIENQHTLITMNDMAGVAQILGDFEAAETLLQQAIKFQLLTLGLTHPNTQASYSNLKYLYRMINDPEFAVTVYQRVLEIQLERLGPDHQDSRLSMRNLASALKRVRDEN